MSSVFSIESNNFLLNGRPFRILSGAIHYFRVPEEYWKDRLLKLRAMGLNTVETYIAWNMHEKSPGIFDFTGNLDIEKYIKTAEELGLYVIVRPGPYICAEWEFGGLPYWLLKDPQLKLRCSDKAYLVAVERYFNRILSLIRPLQITEGGPVILMQIENEYGSFGNDREYLNFIKNLYLKNQIEVPLFTSDQCGAPELVSGTLPDVTATVNFASKARENINFLKKFRPSSPLMCMEFWCGWFDHWGEKSHLRDPEETAEELDNLLSEGASVNIYMFHGGTNWGFMNGANDFGADPEDTGISYSPTVTSYDYDAPLSEAGDITPKYLAMRRVIKKYLPDSYRLPDIPENTKKEDYGKVEFNQSCGLFDILSEKPSFFGRHVKSKVPLSMEEMDQCCGFILYSTELPYSDKFSGITEKLVIHGLKDRALIFLNGKFSGTAEYDNPEIQLNIEGARVNKISILVENLGRINYGLKLQDNRKGITGNVSFGPAFLFDWEITSIPLDNISLIDFSGGTNTENTPRFFKGNFYADSPADTFVNFSGWNKGVCWVNGKNTGRYWKIGPQKSLYIPAPYVKKGNNEIVVFELQPAGLALIPSVSLNSSR